jgi:hypothetical protein
MKHIVDEINDAYVTLHKRKKKNKKMISNGNWVIDMQREGNKQSNGRDNEAFK